MKTIFRSLAVLFLLIVTEQAASNWPALAWSEREWAGRWRKSAPGVGEGKNVRWKVPIPGLGHATPIVWGDRIFVQTAVKTEKVTESEGQGRRAAPTNLFQYKVLALDRRNGKTVWEKTVREARPHEGCTGRLRLHRIRA